MSVHLGEVFRTTFRIPWRNKKLWLWQTLPCLAFMFLLPPILFYYSALKKFGLDIDSEFPLETSTKIIFDIGNSLFVLSFILLCILAQIMAMHGVNVIEEEIVEISFIEILKKSLPSYGRVFGLYFLFISAWVLIIFILQSIIQFTYKAFPTSIYYASPFAILLLPAILVSICVVQLAQASIIIDNLSIPIAISRGWKLLLANGWNAIPMVIVLYYGGSLFFSLPFTSLIFVFFISVLFITRLPDPDVILFIIFFIGIPLLVFLSMIILGVVLTFFQSGWVILYRRISRSEENIVKVEQQEAK